MTVSGVCAQPKYSMPGVLTLFWQTPKNTTTPPETPKPGTKGSKSTAALDGGDLLCLWYRTVSDIDLRPVQAIKLRGEASLGSKSRKWWTITAILAGVSCMFCGVASMHSCYSWAEVTPQMAFQSAPLSHVEMVSKRLFTPKPRNIQLYKQQNKRHHNKQQHKPQTSAAGHNGEKTQTA